MAKITKLSLYILNRSIFRRYVVGVPRSALSFGLQKGDNYAENIEDEKLPTHYQSTDYDLLANILSWETYQLLPPDNTPYSDGTLVDKIVFSLANPMDAEEVLLGMKENDFFSVPKSIEQVYDHLYLTKKEKNSTKREVIQNVLANLVKKGILRSTAGHYLVT